MVGSLSQLDPGEYTEENDPYMVFKNPENGQN